jgi:succinyldiaminopimelate transaminase
MTSECESDVTFLAERLPDFPWDRLAPYGDLARRHPDGIVDLSVGTPVDPVPDVIQQALARATNLPGYPLTAGTVELREAMAQWAFRVLGAELSIAEVMPTIGSKELVGLLPTLLGLGSADAIAIPEVAYPTYDVGARVSQSRIVRADRIEAWEQERPSLIWLNSPSNPTGRVMDVEQMRSIVDWARENNSIVVSDECYLSLGWTKSPISILDPRVCGSSRERVLAVHSLSKRSNLAGYRVGMLMGDSTLIAPILEARKHLGLIMPGPVQHAAIIALADDDHVEEQRERYRRRRESLAPALIEAGFRIDLSEAGLYLWSTRDESSWESVQWLAERGILVAPGAFYGAAGDRHVRVALTATDERIDAAVERLAT